MSGLIRPRNLLIAGGLGAAVYLSPINPFHTPGVQNVTDRYSAGGGSHNHQPGVATQRGRADITSSDQISPKGADTKHFEENVASQKVGTPGPVAKAFNETQLGQSKGK
ncbi:hypothetical protein K431DRAFT_281046 [Polychaeton citri CBS 116435]|uniref:Uncharacterized protein n=1 Tax=Polychaeton citri CBS 116435 TaxID=1314669 RepID=A0A9P4UUF6_9PEZI|nr:hypothetical protein K431DRAFT_281046 [Polychaeton citri CBS 116435]